MYMKYCHRELDKANVFFTHVRRLFKISVSHRKHGLSPSLGGSRGGFARCPFFRNELHGPDMSLPSWCHWSFCGFILDFFLHGHNYRTYYPNILPRIKKKSPKMRVAPVFDVWVCAGIEKQLHGLQMAVLGRSNDDDDVSNSSPEPHNAKPSPCRRWSGSRWGCLGPLSTKR